MIKTLFSGKVRLIELNIMYNFDIFSQDFMDFTPSNRPNSQIPQYNIQNNHVYMSVVNGALWDMGQLYCGFCEFDPLITNNLFYI